MDGGILQMLPGTRRVERGSGRISTRKSTVRHRIKAGDRERNITVKGGLGPEMDIDLESMEAGPRWEGLQEKTS